MAVNPFYDVFSLMSQQATNPTAGISNMYKQLLSDFDLSNMSQIDYEKELQNIFSRANEPDAINENLTNWQAFGKALRDPDSGLGDALIAIGSALMRPGSTAENLAIGLATANEALNRSKLIREAKKERRRERIISEGIAVLEGKTKNLQQEREKRQEKINLLQTATQLFQMDNTIKSNAAQLFLRGEELKIAQSSARKQEKLIDAQLEEINSRRRKENDIPISNSDPLGTKLILQNYNEQVRKGTPPEEAFKKAVSIFAPYADMITQVDSLNLPREGQDGTIKVGTSIIQMLNDRIKQTEESFLDVTGRYKPEFATEEAREKARAKVAEETVNLIKNTTSFIGGQYGTIMQTPDITKTTTTTITETKQTNPMIAAAEAFVRAELKDPTLTVREVNGELVVFDKNNQPVYKLGQKK